jgi:regulator of sigma E protease
MIFSNNLLVFILALSFLLFTHELGHFLIGKLFRIEAEEFGFGYPPRLARLFRWGKTDFTLNWIPFGAFVRFKGEDDPNSEGGFYAANKWQRLGTLLAGPAMNILVGIILFSLVIARAGYANTDVIRIAEVAPDSPAADAGVLPGDQLLMVTGSRWKICPRSALLLKPTWISLSQSRCCVIRKNLRLLSSRVPARLKDRARWAS